MSSFDAYGPPGPQPQEPHGPLPPGSPAFAGGTPWFPPPRPGIVPLAPLRLSDYVNATIALVRTHPLPLLALGAAAGVLAGLFATLLSGVVTDTLAMYGDFDYGGFGYGGYGGLRASSLVVRIALLVVIIFPLNVALLGLYAGVGVAAGRGSMGQVASVADVRQALRAVMGPLLALSGLYLAVQAVLVPASVAIVLIPAARMTELANYDDPDPAQLFSAIGIFLLALFVITFASVPFGYVTARLGPAVTVLVLERQADGSRMGCVAALKRSWQLTKGHGWRLFGITMLFSLMLGIASSLVTLPFSFLAFIPSIVISTFFSGLSTAVVATLIIPIEACVPAIAYLDMRLRKENLGAQIAHHVGLA